MYYENIARRKLTAYLFVLGCVFFILTECSPPSKTDLERLSALNEIYGDSFSFKFRGDNHLEARSRKDIEISENELISIYKVFFFDETMTTRRNDTYKVFLTFVDYQGRTRYNLMYSPYKKDFLFFELQGPGD